METRALNNTISRVEFTREALSLVQKEIEPLLKEHYEEIAWNQEKIPLRPDWAKYQKLEVAGILRVFAARRSGALIGYAVYFVSLHLHYSETLWAANDIIFVRKSERGSVGVKLLRFSETELRSEGVKLVGLHIKLEHDWSRMAERLGYEKTEFNLLKWIGG